MTQEEEMIQWWWCRTCEAAHGFATNQTMTLGACSLVGTYATKEDAEADRGACYLTIQAKAPADAAGNVVTYNTIPGH